MTTPQAERLQRMETRRQQGDLRAYTVSDWVGIALKASIGLAIAQFIVGAVLAFVAGAAFMGLAMLGAGVAAGT